MKLKEKYTLLKRENYDYVILLKSGSFYVTYDNDASILNYLFSYQIVNGKIGFPLKNIDKVTDELHNKSINYIIDNGEDTEKIRKKYQKNNYSQQFEYAKKNEFKLIMNNMLLERIKFLINSNEENYDKIRRFIDEL